MTNRQLIEYASPAKAIVADERDSVRNEVSEILIDQGFVVELTPIRNALSERPLSTEPRLAVVGLDAPDNETAPIDASNQLSAAVIALAAHPRTDTVERAKQMGACALLPIPLKKEEFVPAVHIALARFIESHQSRSA